MSPNLLIPELTEQRTHAATPPTQARRAAPDLRERYTALPTASKRVMRLKSLVFFPTNKTSFLECATRSGLREPDGKAWASRSLNLMLDDLVQQKLLTGGLACAPALLHSVTIDAAESAEAGALGAAVGKAFPALPVPTYYTSASAKHDADALLRLIRMAAYLNDDAGFAANMIRTPCLRPKRHIARHKEGIYPGVDMACNMPITALETAEVRPSPNALQPQAAWCAMRYRIKPSTAGDRPDGGGGVRRGPPHRPHPERGADMTEAAMLYDVIVVGGGSAGAPAAAALSADPSRRVLLLEAGPDWRAADAPAAMLSANIIPFMNDPAHQAAWQWPGLATRRTRAQQPRFYWRGRGLGGSSIVNAQIAIRGVSDAFDAWAEAGCEGWSADQVLPVFDSFEHDPELGRTGGPIPVYRTSQALWGPVDLALRDAALACGYPWNPDLNAAAGEGVSCYPINSRAGRRVSTNEAFLEPVRSRPNLVIMGGALVDRVLLTEGVATGVRVRLPDRGWTELAAREVLLCAGAVHSPTILMRSGLGPAAALRRLGIPVVRDLPWVGQNLMDHPILRATLQLRAEVISRDADARHTNCCVTYTSGLAGGRRDGIFIAFNHRGLGKYGFPSGTGAVGGALFDAFSRGEVRLASPDPEANPEVDENMLDDPRDRLRLRDTMRRLSQLAAHPALTGLAERITFADTDLALPDAAALPDADLDALMMEQAADLQHAAGTCRMSAYEDPRGVVDPDLRVKGVAGLRVADAAVMPLDCRANTHFTCVMIGTMAARLMSRSVP